MSTRKPVTSMAVNSIDELVSNKEDFSYEHKKTCNKYGCQQY